MTFNVAAQRSMTGHGHGEPAAARTRAWGAGCDLEVFTWLCSSTPGRQEGSGVASPYHGAQV